MPNGAHAAQSRRSALTLFLGLAVAGWTGCTRPSVDSQAPAPGRGPAPGIADIGRFTSPNPGAVNTFWVSVPQGLVVVDTGRNISGARRAVAEIQRSGRPVAGILITHSHPDHIAGIGIFHEAFPQAPVYASEPTVAWMRNDPLNFYKLARDADPDFPTTVAYPDAVFSTDASLDIGGARFETLELGPGESETATAYYQPATRGLFSGDVTGNRVTPAMLEGHTCAWLTNLDRLSERFPNAQVIYPGHGDPADAHEQIDLERRYLQHFRSLVKPTVGDGSDGGTGVTSNEQARILEEMEREYPGYPRVASLTTLPQLNVAAVAGEIGHQNPATLPAVCNP